MSDLDEGTATKLLRILTEQSITNRTIEIPPPNPPSSILTVSSLWFLSIISSLAATTWAILCLEWCASLTDIVQAEDYEEMAEKRQRRFEAVNRLKIRLVVAAIPFFLHLSLFLFLAGLWLRLRDVNEQLGLIVGVPSLVIASSYVAVVLLPVFTDIPFSTSATELVQVVVDWIKPIARLGRLIHHPRLFSWIASHLKVGTTLWSHVPPGPDPPHPPPCPAAGHVVPFLKRAYSILGSCTRVLWGPMALLPATPTFVQDQHPFIELRRLNGGRRDRDKGLLQRALFWLLNTPLYKTEVKEILTELGKRRDKDGKPLDRTMIRLLVLSLSSVLDNNDVSEDERPIFDYCTAALAEEMDRAFEGKKDNRKILDTRIPKTLFPHFDLATPGEDYWNRGVPALWLCPSEETIQGVLSQLNQNIQSIEVSDLQRIVRGLHAATLVCFGSKLPPLKLIPNFGDWNRDPSSSDQGLDKALLVYLQSLFAALYDTPKRRRHPITITSLVIDLLQALDNQPSSNDDQPNPTNNQPNPNDDQPNLNGDPRLYNALYFFVAVAQRSDPGVFEEGPIIASALLKSAESWRKYSGGDDSEGAQVLAIRLRAIAYGPRLPISKQKYSLARLRGLYDGLDESIQKNHQCLEGFLDANAATLEAALAVDGRSTSYILQPNLGDQTIGSICAHPPFISRRPAPSTSYYANALAAGYHICIHSPLHSHTCPNGGTGTFGRWPACS